MKANYVKAKKAHKKLKSVTSKEKLYSASKMYKSAMRRAKRDYIRDIHSEMRTLRSSNPKKYWAVINKSGQSTDSSCSISIDNFMYHFQSMNQRSMVILILIFKTLKRSLLTKN